MTTLYQRIHGAEPTACAVCRRRPSTRRATLGATFGAYVPTCDTCASVSPFVRRALARQLPAAELGR